MVWIQSVAHLVALAAVWLADLPPPIGVTLVLLVGASLAVQRRPPRHSALVLGGDGRLEVVAADGGVRAVPLAPQTLALPFLTILLWPDGWRLSALALMPDSMPAGEFRELRLWLRWRAAIGSPAGAPKPSDHVR